MASVMQSHIVFHTVSASLKTEGHKRSADEIYQSIYFSYAYVVGGNIFQAAYTKWAIEASR